MGEIGNTLFLARNHLKILYLKKFKTNHKILSYIITYIILYILDYFKTFIIKNIPIKIAILRKKPVF